MLSPCPNTKRISIYQKWDIPFIHSCPASMRVRHPIYYSFFALVQSTQGITITSKYPLQPALM